MTFIVSLLLLYTRSLTPAISSSLTPTISSSLTPAISSLFPDELSDFGFDPLGLGEVPENLERYKESELIHCRWAMLAVDSVCNSRLTRGLDHWRT
ncbi:Chlorophyll A-B binding protein [Arabidopsis suecica]|uniref:Chlorophyll a-b binding protein, chloroplastic n=1 Tax=Arabidopsis suecica TaxID=45249 RepID=A0A8T1ZBQ0_ARASU|nr:Chlorophyll A-B binding protein [Arabidopsis suecica]